MTETILVSRDSNVAYIKLDRSEIGNKINSQMTGELRTICAEINHDTDIRVVVISGSGNTFCNGSELNSIGFQETAAAEIAGINVPVIAAINGDALGEGLELVLACDIRITSDTAHFGLPQINAGLIPTDGGTQRLPRLIGRAKAIELIITGDTIDAATALEIGLVHRVLPDDRLMGEVETMAKTMASKAPFALRYAKEAVLKGMDLSLEQGLHLEADLYMLLHTTFDRAEGISAFREKRTPDFRGK